MLEMAIVEEAWWLICGVRLLDRDREGVALHSVFRRGYRKERRDILPL